MERIERVAIPKNASFTSVTDVLLINQSEATDDVKLPQHEPPNATTGIPASTTATPPPKEQQQESAPSKKSVQFGLIDQRIYNRMVGDHPDVRVGPPITFSWEYGVLPSTFIDEYEHQKQQASSSKPYAGLRRLSSITRKNILRTLFDVSEDEILAAEREVQVIHRQRERSASQSTASALVESNFRRAGRKLRKSVGKAFLAMATLPLPSYAVPSY